jgi:hypothetical protein
MDNGIYMSNLIVLDCESFDSALHSLALIFRCKPVLLRDFLSIPEIDINYEENPNLPMGFREYLYEVVVKHIGQPQMLDSVSWFHTTRIRNDAAFSEGILPLGVILPNLITMLADVLDDPDKEQFRAALDTHGISDSHYSNKTNNDMHWGPFAILVRDVAFQANKLGQHDYLGMPEIIEDICNGLSKNGGPDFIEQFRAKLKPAIVKFTSNKVVNDVLIATALCYVRSCILQKELDCNSVNCFNGENEAVPYSDIVGVEFVE